jgi:hypothetical protein
MLMAVIEVNRDYRKTNLEVREDHLSNARISRRIKSMESRRAGEGLDEVPYQRPQGFQF